MSDASERATLTAKLEQAEQRIAELEYSVRLLRGADETAESLAGDLTRATQRVAELEQDRDQLRARVAELESRRCENCAYWSDDGGEGKCEEPPSWTCGAFRRRADGK